VSFQTVAAPVLTAVMYLLDVRPRAQRPRQVYDGVELRAAS
jgi:hypothetical protein